MDEAMAVLARTPAALDAMLRGLPDGWLAANEGGDTWSPFDVVGHLIHGERTDWVPRARIIQQSARGLSDLRLRAEFSRRRRLKQCLDPQSILNPGKLDLVTVPALAPAAGT